MALDFSENLLHRGADLFDMAVVHGGDEQLIVRSGYTVRMFGRDMSIVSDFELSTPPGALSIAASEEFIYATINDGDYIACLTHDGTKVATWEDPVKSIVNTCARPRWTALLLALR